MLARELKTRRIAELGERLEVLLTQTGSELLASLNLSLERLDPQIASYLPRLGVFHGGAFEYHLVAICELEEAQWLPLRRGLEQTGLIQAERVPGVTHPFLRFHPTLSPAMAAKLTAEEKVRVTARYQERYYQTSGFLYDQDSKAIAAVRAIARRELPNLLAAVHGTLDGGAPYGVNFADNVSRFLGLFGLSRDRAALIKRAQIESAERGSHDWYLARANLADQLFEAGSFRDAEILFADILSHIEKTPSFRRCSILFRLGRCYRDQQLIVQAEALCRRALADAGQLDRTSRVGQLMGQVHTVLGDALTESGRYREARVEYEAALAIATELHDGHNLAVTLGQLGSLALYEHKLDEAETRLRQALKTFRELGEPVHEATAWHQLGLVYQEANRLREAEEAYRDSAHISERYGDRVGAARSWGQLAQLLNLAGRPDDAEAWYGKALQVMQAERVKSFEARLLNNLGTLLVNRPGRLGDARGYAEKALAIKRTMDPAAAEIWSTFRILAEIAGKEGNSDATRGYRREERASYAAAPIGQETLRPHGDFVKGVVAAVADPSTRPELEHVLAQRVEDGWTKLVEALRRTLDGGRDEDALCEPLDREDSVIVGAVLSGIADSETLKAIPSRKPATKDGEAADKAAQLLQKHLPLITAVITAAGQPEIRPQLDAILQEMEGKDWRSLVSAIRRMIEGERNTQALLAKLDEEDSLIIGTILAGIENPEEFHELPGGSSSPTSET